MDKIILLILFLTPHCLFAQKKKEYQSKAAEAYYMADLHKGFIPVPVNDVKELQYKNVKIVSGENFSHPTKNVAGNKMEKIVTQLNPGNLFKDSVESRTKICSYINGKDILASLYLNSVYDSWFGDPGYWISIQTKNKTEEYYTGLSENNYLRLFDPGFSIWKNDSTLQFRASKVRLIKPFIHALGGEEYEFLEENLLVEIKIADLIEDTDNDGLTNIVEEKMMLNPTQKDTDGDGKNDNEDRNPRFKEETSNESMIYKAMLDPYLLMEETQIRNGELISPKRPTRYMDLKQRVIFIVTDNYALQHARFEYDQFIIVTSNEYAAYKRRYPIPPNEITISPELVADNLTGVFFIIVDQHIGDMGPEVYMIKKNDDGYSIELRSWKRPK